jgi:hypothetical protein
MTKLKKTDHPLHERLKELQATSKNNALVNYNPGKWLEAAMTIYNGKSTMPLRANGHSGRVIAQIRRQIAGNLSEVQEQKLEELRNMIDEADYVSGRQIDAYAQQEEIMSPKEFKEFNVGVEFLQKRVNRLETGADQIIRHEKAKSPEELAKELEELFMENTLEAEIVEDNEH